MGLNPEGVNRVNVDCPICDAFVKDVNPTLGEAWNHCEACRTKICDAKELIHGHCPHCDRLVTASDFMGTYHPDGEEALIYQCFSCKEFVALKA